MSLRFRNEIRARGWVAWRRLCQRATLARHPQRFRKKKRGSEEWERWTRAKRSTENKVFKPRLQIATAERIVAHARAKYLPSIHKPRSAAAGLSDRQPERSR